MTDVERECRNSWRAAEKLHRIWGTRADWERAWANKGRKAKATRNTVTGREK